MPVPSSVIELVAKLKRLFSEVADHVAGELDRQLSAVVVVDVAPEVVGKIGGGDERDAHRRRFRRLPVGAM